MHVAEILRDAGPEVMSFPKHDAEAEYDLCC